MPLSPRRHPPFLFILVALSVAAAGCLGSERAPETETQAPADEPETSLDTGSVTGQVASTGFELLEGATVFLHLGDDLNSRSTDAEGRYTFNGVPPGKHIVDVTKIGFQNARKTVEVEAGKVAQLSFQLERLRTPDPYQESYEFTGFYDCAFGSFFITDTCTFVQRTAYDAYVEETGGEPPFPRDVQNNANTFYWEAGKNVSAVMSEMVWRDVAENTNEMMMLLSSTPIHNDCDCSDEDYIFVTRESPARALLGFDLDEEAYPDDVVVLTGGDAEEFGAALEGSNGTLEVASRGFLPFSPSVAYGQEFTIYVTVFYDMVPESDFTAVPDG